MSNSMSYASVAARDAPPPSQQPHPDPALLTTGHCPSRNDIDMSKVNVISRDEDPSTYTSDVCVPEPEDAKGGSIGTGRTEEKSKRKKHLQEVRAEVSYLWEATRHYMLRPGVASGLVGLVNIGLLSSMGYTFYSKPNLRRNFTAVGSSAIAALLVIGAEGYVAEKHTEIQRGKQLGERDTCKRSAVQVYKRFREHFFRPGVLSGSVGLVNSAIIAAVGYYGYTKWDKPKWNRDIVTAISLGLLTLWSGEEYLVEHYYSGQHRY